MAPRFALWLALTSVGLGGCVCVASKQDWHYKVTNKYRACQAWKCCYTSEQQKCLGCDFESGFKAGYCDRSIGKDCRVPPVPPPRYWTAKYQCCEGQTCIQNWFRGYERGIAVAESKGHPFFNQVPVSSCAPTVNKTACGMCKSCEPCECECNVGVPSQPFAESPPEDYSASDMEATQDIGAPVPPPVDLDSSALPQTQVPPPPQPIIESRSKSIPKAASDESQSVVEDLPPEIGLIGGFGATQTVLFGPMDKVFFDASDVKTAEGSSRSK